MIITLSDTDRQLLETLDAGEQIRFHRDQLPKFFDIMAADGRDISNYKIEPQFWSIVVRKVKP